MNTREDVKEIRRTVAALHGASETPITFGGPVVAGKHLRISELIGTATDALSGLTVDLGRGLGGRVLALARPTAVSDYQNADLISHEYDKPVRDEGVRSAIAVPVVVRRAVRAVLYTARREPLQLGDRSINATITAARDLEQELAVRDEVDQRIAFIERQRRQPGGDSPTGTAGEAAPREAVRQAHAELRVLAAQTADEWTRTRVYQVCDSLSKVARDAKPVTQISLAPRELDVLSCVALGHTNAEIASELGLLPETVKSYLRTAMRKLDCHTRMHAVAAARRAGLLP